MIIVRMKNKKQQSRRAMKNTNPSTISKNKTLIKSFNSFIGAPYHEETSPLIYKANQ